MRWQTVHEHRPAVNPLARHRHDFVVDLKTDETVLPKPLLMPLPHRNPGIRIHRIVTGDRIESVGECNRRARLLGKTQCLPHNMILRLKTLWRHDGHVDTQHR